MTHSAFIYFLATGSVLLGAILFRADRKRAGRWLLFGLTFILFLFAGWRSQRINSDTASYASYALHFQKATLSEDPEITDRLEWGFRLFLRFLAKMLPAGDDESYPLYVNLSVATLGGLLLCRAVHGARGRIGILLLVYLCSLFFVHQFAIMRLGLATLLFLNYFIPTYTHRKFHWVEIVFLGAGCLMHYTILATALVLLAWEAALRLIRSPVTEFVSFAFLLTLAALFGMIAEHLAPLFLSGYHLSLVARGAALALSPKGLAEVTFCVILFILHFKTIRWSYDHRSVRWRVLFYLTLVSFLVEVVSGLPFVGRFRILAYCLFIIQTVMITGGINFTRRTTWLILLATTLSVAAQVITISHDDTWFVLIDHP